MFKSKIIETQRNPKGFTKGKRVSRNKSLEILTLDNLDNTFHPERKVEVFIKNMPEVPKLLRPLRLRPYTHRNYSGWDGRVSWITLKNIPQKFSSIVKLMIKPLVPCLWFNNQAEEAVTFYLDIFPHSKIEKISRYGKEGFEYHGMPEGTVLTIDFTINGMSFTALNGGPMFSFTEAVSFQVLCDTQDEIDYYWSRLTDGGEESMCGWLKDKFGLSWQIIPSILSELMNDPERSGRVAQAFLQMRKFDIEKILNA